jgi:ribosome maturation factor RimP
MDIDSLKAKIEALIDALMKANFLELADLDVVGGGTIIRLYIDKQNGGITLDECADFHRMAMAVIDASGVLVPGDYELEVSSPGINRPLKKREAFAKYAGKKVRIVMKEKVGNDKVFAGILNGINADAVLLSVNGNEISLDFNNIKKANVEADFF